MTAATLKLDGGSVDEALGLVERHTMIVGASRGLGEAVARALGAMPGARLSLCARSYNRLTGLTMEIGTERSAAISMDVCDLASIQAGVRSAAAAFGPPQGLVITVGSHKMTPVHDTSEAAVARFESVLRTTLIGPWQVAQQAAAQMASGGSIVFVGNIRAERGMAGRHAHAAAKHGLVALAKGMAAELGPRGVRVNVVVPGHMNTELGVSLLEQRATRSGAPLQTVLERAGRTTALRRMLEPGDVAAVVQFLLSPASAGVTGEAIEVSCGATVG